MKHKKRWPVCLISLTRCCTVARADDRRLIEKLRRKTYDNYALSLKIPYMHRRIFTSTPRDNLSEFRLLGFGRRAQYFKWA
jgi:hypothetical protein